MAVGGVWSGAGVGHELLVVRGVVFLVEAGGETKVGQLDVTAPIEKDVVGLDVTMDEAQLVNGLDGESNLGHVEASNILGEDLVLDEHRHKITTRQELHEHVQKGRVLERGVQLDKPRAVCVGQDITLSADVGELVFFELEQRSG